MSFHACNCIALAMLVQYSALSSLWSLFLRALLGWWMFPLAFVHSICSQSVFRCGGSVRLMGKSGGWGT